MNKSDIHPQPRWKGVLRNLVGSWRPAHYAVLLLANVHSFSTGGRAGGWDWANFIYPWADALRLTILKYHQFPWWNAWSFSGQPFLAEPQTAVLMPDTLFIVAFGSIVGYKLIILFYNIIGYEGSRFLCRQLFGSNPRVDALSIIPALSPALALHLSVGHPVMLSLWLFPWLLALALTWHQSAPRAVALGVVVGCFFLTYIHYCIIIGFTIVGPIVFIRLLRSYRSRRTWILAAIVVCTSMGMGFMRLVLVMRLISGFPRVEVLHYPIVANLTDVFRFLIEPLQTNAIPFHLESDLGWWEVGSYVGLAALMLWYEGFRRMERRLWPLYAAAILCFILAWNNRDKWLPGYWMHIVPPWRYMVIATRWRLFGCYFLLLGTVHGLLTIIRRGGRRTAALLALFVVADLGFHTFWAYRNAYVAEPVPWERAPDPPRTVQDNAYSVWRHFRMNLVSMGPQVPLLGWKENYPKRDHLGTPGYRGDFFGTQPVQVITWSPNRVVLTGVPGDTLTINANPSSYWLMNGQRLFPSYRPMEPDKPFRVIVPSSGRVELIARPPGIAMLLIIQAIFAAAALVLYRRARVLDLLPRRLVDGFADRVGDGDQRGVTREGP
ncbi:MAG TPA: hypothetical protein VN541_20505 [Tepidisphaeraceae bacterium]|nr:hypothetical protein [Tepidisphaeraceae bacterium]